MASASVTNAEANRVVEVNSANAFKVFDSVSNSLVPTAYDFISLSYLSDNLTVVVYKEGGAAGTTVSTLTLTYDLSSNITSVTQT